MTRKLEALKATRIVNAHQSGRFAELAERRLA